MSKESRDSPREEDPPSPSSPSPEIEEESKSMAMKTPSEPPPSQSPPEVHIDTQSQGVSVNLSKEEESKSSEGEEVSGGGEVEGQADSILTDIKIEENIIKEERERSLKDVEEEKEGKSKQEEESKYIQYMPQRESLMQQLAEHRPLNKNREEYFERRVSLCTNYFQMTPSEYKLILIHGISFSPEIAAENRGLRRKIVGMCRSQIEGELGYFIFRGNSIFSPAVHQRGDDPIVSAECTLNETTYSVEIVQQNWINLEDVENLSKNYKDKQIVLTFYNTIIKTALSASGLIRTGRNMKYLNPFNAALIPEYNVEIWTGYFTSTHYTNRGLLLEVDFASRVLRSESVLDKLSEFKGLCAGGGNFAESFLTMCRRDLVGKSFLARYGGMKTYIIDDIVLQMNPLNHLFTWRGKQTNLLEYYQQQYNITIADVKQPLILNYDRYSRESGENVEEEKKSRYFVPELCSMTGIPEEMKQQYYVMEAIAKHTRLTPTARIEKIKQLFNLFQVSDKKDAQGKLRAEQPKDIFDRMRMNIIPEPISIEGAELKRVTIIGGQKNEIRLNENGIFGQMKSGVYNPLPLNHEKWILTYHQNDYELAESLYKNLEVAGISLGIKVEQPRWAQFTSGRESDIIGSIKEQIIRSPSLGNPEIVLLLLNERTQHEYGGLKKVLLEKSTLSQVILRSTITKSKGGRIMSVCGNILKQINAKRKGSLWILDQGTSFNEKLKYIMVVGIDVSREGNSSVLGFTSTISASYDRCYTQTIQLPKRQEIAHSLYPLMVKSLDAFKGVAEQYPQYIIIYRDGVGETEQDILRMQEFESMKDGIKEKAGYKPFITYAIINKKTKTRIFRQEGGELNRGGRQRGGRDHEYSNRGELLNAHPGTVVWEGVLDQSSYTFLLMPHYVNQGTGTPTQVTVLYDNTPKNKSPPENFIKFTNEQCYLYFNWQGPIRTPAVCQYAFKAAHMQAKYTGIQDKLNDTFYFI